MKGTEMFKNRHIELKLVKDDESTPVDETLNQLTPEEFATLAEYLGGRVVLGTITVIATTVILTTLSKIDIKNLT